MSLISVYDPKLETYTLQESNDVVLHHVADSSGNYVGLLSEGFEGCQYTSAPPTEYKKYYWHNEWLLKPLTLDQEKDKKWEEIKNIRESKNNLPLVTQYGIFDADTRARSNIYEAVIRSMISNTGIDFTLHNNKVVSLTPTQISEVGVLLGTRVQSVIDTATKLRALIYECASIEELDSITWPE